MTQRPGPARRRGQPGQHDSSLIRPEFGLAALLFTSVILLGSAHFHVATALAAATCLAFTPRKPRERLIWGAPSKLCFALAAWTFLSVVPLPPGLLQWLAPVTSELWLSGFVLTGQSPGTWTPLSLDPIASAAEVTKWLSYALLAATAGTVARRKGLNPILLIVWGCAVLVALVSIFQTASGLTTVLGLYEPVSRNPTGTPSLFVNPNNLAGFCNLGTFSGIGLISSRRNRIPPSVLYVGTILCAATCVLTASRAGTITLLVGALILLGSWILSNPRAQFAHYRSAIAGATIAVVAGVAFTVLSASANTWRELLNDDLSKMEYLGRLGPALSAHWLFGVGRGAFETVSFLYYGETQHVVHRSVENFAMSWAVEWGIPAAALGIGYMGWSLRPRRLRLRASRSAQACFATLIVIAVQNMGDLGLELFSLTAAVFALTGALDGSRHERMRVPAPDSARRATKAGPWIRVAAGVAVLIASVALYLGPDNFSVKRRVYREVNSATAENVPFSQVREILTREMKWRPGEPYFALLGAEAALARQMDALPWASAALARAPGYARAHLLTARSLLQRKALSQATIHLRAALDGENQIYGTIAELMVSQTKDLKLLEAAAPQNAIGAIYLLAVRHRVNATHPYLGTQLLEAAIARAPQEEKVLAAQGFQLVADLARGSYTCGPEDRLCEIKDRDEWAQKIRAVAAQHPGSYTCANRRVLSRLAQIEANDQQALEALKGCEGCQVAEPCLRDLITFAAQIKNVEKRKEAERHYLESACTGATTCAQAELWLGRNASTREDWLAAATHFSKAASYEPSGANWLLVADAAVRANQIAQAELAYKRANALGSTNEQIAAAIRKARLDFLRP